jgi:serine/threonine-protein kinase
MSPEQTQGARLDPRSDLWSLGVMAFRVLTGRVPFPGEVIWEIVAAICTQPVPSASDHELPATLDRFFARALARNLERRIDTAKSFARAFRAAVEGRDAELDDALAARAGALAETVPSWRPESGRPSSEPLAETREQAPARVGSTTARAVGTLMPRSEPRGASLLKSVGIAVLAGALVAGLGWFAGRRSASQGPIDSRDAAATAATTSAAETAPVRAVESPIGSGVDARAASAATTVQSAHAKSPAVAQAPAPVAASASPTARPSASPAIPSATASPPPASKPSSNEFGI